MAGALYMDHHVSSSITKGLRRRGVDVITAYEDGAYRLDDSALLDRAYVLQRVIFTRDDDFLVEAARRQREGVPFYGVIYAHQLRVPTGVCIEQLELIIKASRPDELLNYVIHLPI
jgi:hypothetical protein